MVGVWEGSVGGRQAVADCFKCLAIRPGCDLLDGLIEVEPPPVRVLLGIQGDRDSLGQQQAEKVLGVMCHAWLETRGPGRGYLKPFGTLPVLEGVGTDVDAGFFEQLTPGRRSGFLVGAFKRPGHRLPEISWPNPLDDQHLTGLGIDDQQY